MNSFVFILVLAITLAHVSTEESANEQAKEQAQTNPASKGHGLRFPKPNNERMRNNLEKIKELIKKNLGLKSKQTENENRNKRGYFGYQQPIHHYDYQPDYVVDEYTEYCYEPPRFNCY